MHRPDDRSGRGFLRALRAVEARPNPPRGVAVAEPVWGPPDALSDGASTELRAECDGYSLCAIEMQADFMAQQPRGYPKISWSVIDQVDRGNPVVGGAAPSMAIAQARAEALWRAFIGIRRA